MKGRHEKSEGNSKQLLSLRIRRRARGERSSKILSCGKPLDCLAGCMG